MTAPVEIDIADAARRDLDDISAFLAAEAGAKTAGCWVRRLEARIGSLAEFPYIGAEDD